MDDTQIIILAAGHGKRMQSELPKALTLLHGKPFIKHLLDSIKESGVCSNPIIVIGQKGDMIRDALGDGYTYAIQKEQLGTGHAVMSAENEAKGVGTVLILYADHPLVTASTIKNLINSHIKSNSILTMATASVVDFCDWREAFLNFGRFVRDESNNIIKIVEVKDATEEEKEIKEVNPSYLCFNADWMWNHLRLLKNDNKQNEYYLTDLVGMAFDEHKKIESICIDPKEAIGVNTKEQLEQIHKI